MVLIQKLNFADFQNYREEFKKCLLLNNDNVKIKKILIFLDLNIDDLPKFSKVQYIVKRGLSCKEIIEFSKKISKEDKFIYSTPFHIFGFELKQNEHNKNLIQTDKYTIFHRDSKIDTVSFNTNPDKSLFKVILPKIEEECVIPVTRKKGELVITNSKKIDNNRLNVVIVSVNYNDFLLTSLSKNYQQFENITIVTSSEDLMCQKICEKFNVNCVVTDIMYEDGAKFNKGKAINAGINSLVDASWILLLDADIIVEGTIDTNLLDGNTLYTADRYLCEEYNKLKLYQNGEIEISSIGQFEPNRGLGFFQLFHSSKENKYPETSDDAAWSDLMFRDKFTSRKKIENSVIHLGRAYTNWEGRKTERFLTDDEFNRIFTKQSTYTICSYYFNFRNDVRQKQNFVKFLEQFNGHYDKMIVGIVDYGDIDFEIPCKSIVVKGDSEKRIWSKEILINKIIDEIDTDYLIWIDGDLIYEDLSWLDNIDSVIKGNDFVQLFETINYLGENEEILETHKSIMSSGRNDIDNLLGEGYKPGGAWLGKTSILKQKKLFEQMYVGGGDTIFVYGLFGVIDGYTNKIIKQSNVEIHDLSINWINSLGKYKINYIGNKITHLFHGELKDRNYNGRYKELSKIELNKNKSILNDGLLNRYFDNIYCANLSKRTDRWEKIKKEFDRLSIKVERFESIDGQKLSNETISKYQNEFGRYRLEAGAIGCLRTHYEIIKDAKKRNFKKILIFEDDVMFTSNFISDFAKKINIIENDYNILYLGSSQYDWNVDYLNKNKDFYHAKSSLGTFAYSIDESVYDLILSKIEITYDLPIDHILSEIQSEVKKTFVFYPNICIADVTNSDIRKFRNQNEHSKKMRWSIETSKNPYFSIIVPTFNSLKLKETIDSIESQSFDDYEYIIIDDGSDFIEENSNLYKRPYFLKKNANSCRNYGAILSKGKYLIFLDSDDILDKDCLKNRYNEITKNDGYDNYIFKMSFFNDEPGDLDKIVNKRQSFTNKIDDFLSYNILWQTTCSTWKREVFFEIGGFDEELDRFQDYDIHIRYLLSSYRTYIFEKDYCDCYYRTSEFHKNITDDKAKIIIKSAEHLINKYKQYKIDFKEGFYRYLKNKYNYGG